MNVEDYKPNSHRSKEEPKKVSAATAEKKVKKVVSGTVTSKKKSEGRKFLESFISEDISSVKDYLLKDVLVPTIKDTFYNAISNGIEMLLWGETRGPRDKKRGRTYSDYVSYSSYSSDKRDRRRHDRFDDEDERTSRSLFDPEDIILSRGDAEAVLDAMADTIDTYGRVSINDLYDMVGRTAPPYTSTRYGWTYLDGNTRPVRVSGGGYILKLPKARPID